jgi:hypothetical protein
MKDMQHGYAVWTCGMYTYVHIQVDAYMYVYILICSKKVVLFRFAALFDEISLKRNETWPWQKEISAKFRFVTKQKKSISGKPYSLAVSCWSRYLSSGGKN